MTTDERIGFLLEQLTKLNVELLTRDLDMPINSRILLLIALKFDEIADGIQELTARV